MDMLAGMDDEILMRFYTDVVNSVVFSTPVAYLSKYPQIEHYQMILDTEELVLRVLYKVVAQEAEKAARIVQICGNEIGVGLLSKILGAIVFQKQNDIRRELLRRQLSQGGLCMVDHNWRLLNIVSCDSNACNNKFLLQLELILNHDDKKSTVTLEMDVHELQVFVNRLRDAKRRLRK